jgi:hypothetical protein
MDENYKRALSIILESGRRKEVSLGLATSPEDFFSFVGIIARGESAVEIEQCVQGITMFNPCKAHCWFAALDILFQNTKNQPSTGECIIGTVLGVLKSIWGLYVDHWTDDLPKSNVAEQEWNSVRDDIYQNARELVTRMIYCGNKSAHLVKLTDQIKGEISRIFPKIVMMPNWTDSKEPKMAVRINEELLGLHRAGKIKNISPLGEFLWQRLTYNLFNTICLERRAEILDNHLTFEESAQKTKIEE